MERNTIEPRPATPLELHRRAVGWSRAELARRAGGIVGAETIARLERRENSPRLATGQALAAALNVEVTALFPEASGG